MKKVVSFARAELLPLSEGQLAEVRELADRLDAVPDAEIGFTDNPEITPERWVQRLPNPNRNTRLAKAH